ncbi:MAG: desulfoferrodoxin family protein [bacterium]
MNNQFIIKKCMKCGAVVNVIEDCHCSEENNISCCGTVMTVLKSNSTDAAVEKHVPEYEVKGNKILVKVNHVMEEDHFIKFIALVDKKNQVICDLTNNTDAVAEFDYIPGSTIYEYCNKHGIWKIDVE